MVGPNRSAQPAKTTARSIGSTPDIARQLKTSVIRYIVVTLRDSAAAGIPQPLSRICFYPRFIVRNASNR
jgi:hypothetical protein